MSKGKTSSLKMQENLLAIKKLEAARKKKERLKLKR